MAKHHLPRIALVGAETLAGRELRDLLVNGRLADRVDLFGEDDKAVEDHEEDAEPLPAVTAEALTPSRVVFLAGHAESSRKASALAPRQATLIDLGGTLDGFVRAPAAEPDRFLPPESRVLSMAHPGAILLASFLRKLPEPPVRAVAQILEPASAWGRAGVATLQEQTVGLLSFRPLNKEAFDEQISFNLLSRFGTESPRRLGEAEDRIRRDLMRLLTLDPMVPVPSFRLFQAPVFHGTAMSVWVEFSQPPDPVGVIDSLRPQADLRSHAEEPPSNVSIAGQSGFSLDEPARDPENPNALWFWLVADNLRLLADNALLTAASILEQAARRVQ